MKIVCTLLAIGVLGAQVSVQFDQENIQAIQIVKPAKNFSFEYVKNNQLDAILNSDEIKDRYVVVVSIVGRMQTGKSFLLNVFLNYLRTTYNVWSPLTNRTYSSADWMDMNVKNGFDSKHNHDGTTKGIWAWPEIFTHDNITDGNKVAIVLLDTEGLFHSRHDLSHTTKIFALSLLFSSMQGFNLIGDVYRDTIGWLEMFTTYSVYGSQIATSSHSTETPFQYFQFIIRDSPLQAVDDNETVSLSRIFIENGTDQNRDIKARFKSGFKMPIRLFRLPNPGNNVTSDDFDGNPTVFDKRFRNKIETMVTESLNPANIVIKEINGERVKAKDLSHFLQVFTEVVENNITVPNSLVEVLANASNWMLHEKYVKLYNDSMFAKLDGKRNESTPYFENAELNSVHADTKNDSIVQFKNLVKYGGDKLATPFEDLLSQKIDECFENIKRINEQMRSDHKVQKAEPLTIICIGVAVSVLFVLIVKASQHREYFRNLCRKRGEPKTVQDADSIKKKGDRKSEFESCSL